MTSGKDWSIRFVPEEDETKTKCPKCAGSGKAFLENVSSPANPGLYRFAICLLCRGEGLVSASKSSGWRLKRLHLDDDGE